MRETWIQSLGRESPLEKKGMATQSSILAWRIPCTEEAGGLQSMGLQKRWLSDQHFIKLYQTIAYKGIYMYDFYSHDYFFPKRQIL